jgi:hypothetical protein
MFQHPGGLILFAAIFAGMRDIFRSNQRPQVLMQQCGTGVLVTGKDSGHAEEESRAAG